VPQQDQKKGNFMPKNIQLIIIDPQNSFCNVVDPAKQQVLHDGELCVTGAWDDMVRVAKLVSRLGDKIDDISVTLDSHDQLHIAHPLWWRNVISNRQPDPFTVMREDNGRIIGSVFQNGQSVDIGEFRTVRRGFMDHTVNYLKALAAGKRYPHVIWPFHCLIGTPGHNIIPPLADALFGWEREYIARFRKVTKGSNPQVEHFSAVRAEVIEIGRASCRERVYRGV
jgi:nicotinamidase-related amidase